MSAILDNLEQLLAGLGVTLTLAVVAGGVSFLMGTALAVARVSPVPALRYAGTVYVNAVRSSPLTVIFYFCVFILPQVGIGWSYWAFAVLALSLYHAAHYCEAIRSGINAVDAGQAEAARSTGLRTGQVLWIVVVPQALRLSVPLIVTVTVMVIKNTSIAGAFAVAELTASTQKIIYETPQAVIPILLVSCALYLIVTIPFGRLAAYIERRVNTIAGHHG